MPPGGAYAFKINDKGQEMPKVTLYVAISEDGFIADKNGGVDWLPPPDPSAKDEVGYNKFYSSMDVLVMGSITYEQVLTFGSWPYQNKKSFVFTQRQLVKPKEQAEVEFTSLQVKGFMEYLNKLNIKNIWLVGGTKLINSFYLEGCIDEYIITTIPKVLIEGIALPKPILEKVGLVELECIDIGSGMKQFHYGSQKPNINLKGSDTKIKQENFPAKKSKIQDKNRNISTLVINGIKQQYI